MTHPGSVAVRQVSQQLIAPLILLLLAGCGHTEPFGSVPVGSDQPFDPTPPVRLTLNQGPDRGAAWLPDGSGIIYSTQQLGRRDHDVCLALIPAGGGSQRRLTCDLTPAGGDSTDAIETPAPSVDGRLAFIAVGSRINAIPPGGSAISVSSLADPANRTTVRTVPYTIPGERLHSGASQLRWLSPTTLLYLGERVEYRHRCVSCVEWDTLTSGLDATLLDLTQPGSFPIRVPGTDQASGVSAGNAADEVYYTLNGDSRVFRRSLSTGDVTVVHDFGAAGIVRDVHVVGNRMAAVIGGRVTFGTDPVLGIMQWDSGGVVHVVDLQGGSDIPLDGPGLFRRPQLSPSGAAVVAEGYPLVIADVPTPGGPPRTDTTVSRRGDLYLFGQP
jgi:hypothetical protein